MISRKTTGLILTVIGLMVASFVSIILATQPATLTNAPVQVILPAALAFVVVFALMIGGAYLILTEDRATENTPPEMENSLILMDILKRSGETTVNQLAKEAKLDNDGIQLALEEMLDLNLFQGYIQRQQGKLAFVESETLKQANQCAVCGKPIRIQQLHTTCVHCQTDYYILQTP
jgi:RNA polymerase-binding transcription factor DksA